MTDCRWKATEDDPSELRAIASRCRHCSAPNGPRSPVCSRLWDIPRSLRISLPEVRPMVRAPFPAGRFAAGLALFLAGGMALQVQLSGRTIPTPAQIAAPAQSGVAATAPLPADVQAQL